jgi:molecular chaperone DnaK
MLDIPQYPKVANVTYELGIDVGTSFTAAAVHRDGSVEVSGLGPIADNIPTVLYLGDDGPMLVGDAANRRASIDPPGAAREFKRRMGDPTPLILRTSPFSAEALVGRMLDYVVQRVADRERGAPRHLVATHPANWGPYKLELFQQSLRMVDVPSSLLAEPQAAAVAYAAQTRVAPGTIIAVYDLGGGTFDAAILRKTDAGFEMLGDSVGIEHLGGVDFDEAIFQYVRQVVGNKWPSDPDDPSLPAPMLHLRRACTEAKELLSSERDASIPVMLPGVDTTVVIQRADFEHMIAPRIDDSVLALNTALGAAGVGTEQIGAVLLVGGSSRIPLVGTMLRERFGPIVASDVDPLYAVARGAAIVAGTRTGAEQHAAASVSIAPSPSLSPSFSLASVATDTATAWPAAPIAPPAALDRPLVEPVAPAVAVTSSLEPPVAVAPEPLQPVAAGPSIVGGEVERSAIATVADVSLPGAAARGGRGRLIGAGVAAAVLAGGIGFAAWNRSRESVSTKTIPPAASSPTTTQAPTTAPAATAAPKPAVAASGANMVPIPAGQYAIGADKPENNASETVTKRVDVAAYSIDKFEVTNEDFKLFVDQTQASSPLGWPSARFPADRPKNPVQGVNFDWAQAYCTSLGKRLPTEIEWEVAARGPNGSLYAWGNDLTQVTLPSQDTYPVGSIEGNRSGFGVFDLTGNVWEWVADSYDKRIAPSEKVLRGGQNGYVRKNVTRLPVEPTASNSVKITGFRCAATTADPATPVVFGDYTKPAAPVLPTPKPLAAGVLIQEDFRDSTSGWVETGGDKKRSGYHPNEFFHIETKAPNEHVLVIAPNEPQVGKLVDVSAKAFPDPDLTDAGGTFDYGLAFAMESTGRGLVFVVSPRTNQWKICNRNVDETYVVLHSGSRTIPDPLDISVKQVSQDTYEFRINGTLVTRQAIAGYPGNAAGMILLSYANNKKAHIHYDSFELAEH